MELKRNILDIKGIKVGQAENPTAKTGVSVVLAEDGAICGVDVRGAGPGTRETDLLNPINTVEKVHAVVLSGGSAFGLEAASGVMNWLEKRGIGFDVGVTSVPIVPSAVLFDLEYGDAFVRPDKEMGMQACENASDSVLLEGDYGAGCGATVGKLRGMAHDGLARCIRPIHTSLDGDTIFCLSTGELEFPENPVDTVGILAARVAEQAIIRAVKAAK